MLQRLNPFHRTPRQFRATFITPNQDRTSGGAHAIERFAQECARTMSVNIIVELHEPLEVAGVRTLPGDLLAARNLPPADALIIPADHPDESPFALPAAMGRPLIFFQGYGTPDSAVVKRNLARAPRVLAVAHWLVDEATRYGARTELTRYGLDRDVFFPGVPTQERPPSLTMMTSPVDWKGLSDGVAAIELARREIPDLEVRLFGHVDVQIAGASFLHLPHRNEIANIMREAAILVCPSWEEGFGLPCLEAMACGAAVATTDTKGSRDYAVHGRTALVSPPRDPAALARNIVALAKDAQLRRTCASNALQFVDDTFEDWARAGEAFATAVVSLSR